MEKCCCDMKGFLTFSTLWLISKAPMSGQELRAEMARRKGGCVPSAGTIYPVLKNLKRDGLIGDTEGDGRTKRYRVTKKGEKELEIAICKFDAMFGDLRTQPST